MSSTDKARANAIPDSETLTKTAQQLNIAHEVQEIPNSEGAKIHWFGDRSARKVILYFHGRCVAVHVRQTFSEIVQGEDSVCRRFPAI